MVAQYAAFSLSLHLEVRIKISTASIDFENVMVKDTNFSGTGAIRLPW